MPGTGIAWPHSVVDAATGELVTSVASQGGYDDEGMFVRATLDVAPDVAQVVLDRVNAWSAGPGAPLATVLADYADALVQLGEQVEVTYPNDKHYAQGTFVGVDVWGRATVRLLAGEELEFPPEKYQIRSLTS